MDAAMREEGGARVLVFPTVAGQDGGGSDPEGALVRRQIRRLLEEAIDRLPGSVRVVLVARDVDGMGVEETAEVLGVRLETVRTRLHRAGRLLRAALEGRLGDPLRSALLFDGARCTRLAEAVLARLGLAEGVSAPG